MLTVHGCLSTERSDEVYIDRCIGNPLPVVYAHGTIANPKEQIDIVSCMLDAEHG